MLNIAIKQVYKELDHARLTDILDEINIIQHTIEQFDSTLFQLDKTETKMSIFQMLTDSQIKSPSQTSPPTPLGNKDPLSSIYIEIVDMMSIKLKQTCLLAAEVQDQYR